MQLTDIIILVCLVPFLVRGFRKGFIDQVVSMLSLIFGLVMAFKFYDSLAAWASTYLTASKTVLQVASFVAIIGGVTLALNIIGHILESLLESLSVGFMDKLLGIGLALLKGVLVVGLGIALFNTLNTVFHIVDEQTLNASLLYNPIKDFTNFLFPKLKEMVLSSGSAADPMITV